MKLRLLTRLVFCYILFAPLCGCQKNNTSMPSKRENPKATISEPQKRKNHEATSSELPEQEDREVTASELSKQGLANAKTSEMKRQKSLKSTIVEIVPNQAIGELRIGMKLAELPKEARATIGNTVGIFHGINFAHALNEDAIDEIWIDKLRTFPYKLSFHGRPVLRDASFDDLKAIFGPCVPNDRVRGGTIFNCSGGINLELDCAESEESVGIRLKPR